jgi:hypothetical protein
VADGPHLQHMSIYQFVNPAGTRSIRARVVGGVAVFLFGLLTHSTSHSSFKVACGVRKTYSG